MIIHTYHTMEKTSHHPSSGQEGSIDAANGASWIGKSDRVCTISSILKDYLEDELPVGNP